MLLCMEKFRELLPVLTCKAISLNSHCQICSSCVRGRYFIHENVGPSCKKIRNVWSLVKKLCSNEYATSKKKQCVITNSPPKSIETEKAGFSVKV